MRSQRCLHERFEARCREFPARIAVTTPDRQLTYAELNDQANALASRLVAAGADGRSPVALCAGRSAMMIAGLLAILKAGAPYLPIDPAYPKDRIDYLLTDSQAAIVLAAPEVIDALPASATRVVCLSHDGEARSQPEPRRRAEPSDLAYVIYTSGSTGRPKGVLVEHRSVTQLFSQTQPLFGFTENDVWTLFHPISFDFSVWEIFGALLHGGRLVIVPDAVRRSPMDFLALLGTEAVTVLNQTPSAFRQLAAAEEMAGTLADDSMRLIIFGGERLDPGLLAGWIDRHGTDRPYLVNMYGTTETTIHTTSRRIVKADLASPALSPIGRPLPGTRICVRDDAGRQVGPGEEGEICIEGPGLARGYMRQPELTAERFVTDQSGEEVTRWYRSGDRAAVTGDGELLYLGRLDDQLKVSGFRVEPTEVEAHLTAHPDVASAVLTAADFGDGDLRLIAHVVPVDIGPADRLPDPDGDLPVRLAEWAAQSLPPHMCPSSYRIISAVPVTLSGKTDRAALAAAEIAERTTGAPTRPAANTQTIVFEIVTDILGNDQIRPDDDLFDHGATSLAFMRILAQLNQRFGIRITGAELEEATIDQLVICADSQRE